MSGPYPKGALSGKGATTPVNIAFAEVSGKDKDVLCMAVCECKAKPEIGKKGQSLRQVCVSKKLSKRDYLARYETEHKVEVNYDMTKNPPVPIMDFETKTMVHRWAPGWIKKYWNEDPTHPLWLPREGYVRRPDVVIVKDPTKPPTQDNIKQVVEIKFDDDPWGEFQAQDYETISGEDKLALLTPGHCSCDDPDRKRRTDQLKKDELMDELSGIVENLGSGRRGGSGRRPRLPKKLPTLKE